MGELSKRQQYEKRYQALKNEREQGWRPHWKDISDYIQPRRSRFLSTDKQNAGNKKNEKIINGKATTASRALQAGLMTGISSPARPWFRCTTRNDVLAEVTAVRQWLHDVEERLRVVIQKSNIYMALENAYGDLGDYGTAALLIDEDPEDLVRAYVFPIGSYCLANSARLAVDTLYRDVSMTAAQLVQQFGKKKCCRQVMTAYNQGAVDKSFEVRHIIEPNTSYRAGMSGPAGKRFSSCWYELARAEDEGFLRESGYEEFPLMAPRWVVTGEDTYGSSPGMTVLGDVRALQLLEKRSLELADKLSRPPMHGPTAMRGQEANLLPGAMNYVDGTSPSRAFGPAIEINPQGISVIEEKIRQHERRIDAGYYVDVLLMISNESGQMTATEVSERREEKMLQLGSVFERLKDELLDPMFDRLFGILLRNGMIPEPPEELQGEELGIDYLSILAQAQKSVGVASVRELAQFTGNLAAVNGEVLDKLDFDQVIDEYSASLGTPPDLIRSDEDVAAMRAQRAKAQQAAAQAQQAAATVQGAKVLSETDTSGDNALTRMLGR